MKILVVALDNLGDAVMASSVAGALRRAIPNARISFWTKSYSAPVLEFCPEVETVFGSDPFWEASRLHARGTFPEFLRTLSRIRWERYDATLILSTEWRRSLFCRMAGISRRVGFDRRKSRFFLTQSVPFPKEEKSIHVLEEHRRLLAAFLGLPVEPLIPRLTLSENHKAAAQRHLHSLRPFADFTLAIHPFCGGTKRLWPTHRFVEFCRQVLVRPGQRIIAFGASPERKELESWKKELGKGFITLPETFDLEESLAILSQCDAFVGLDSGFSHAAAAFGVSTIAVFGPSDPDRFRPVGAGRVKVIKREPLENLRADEMIAELRYIKEP